MPGNWGLEIEYSALRLKTWNSHSVPSPGGIGWVPSEANRNAVVAPPILTIAPARGFHGIMATTALRLDPASMGVPRVVLVPRTNPGLRASTPMALETGCLSPGNVMDAPLWSER